MTPAPRGADADVADGEAEKPVIRDKRRLDPTTGQLRPEHASKAKEGNAVGDEETQQGQPAAAGPSAAQAKAAAAFAAASAQSTSGAGAAKSPESDASAAPGGPSDGGAGGDLAAERLADLQRLQAEYVNYRKRVERDRDAVRQNAIASVLESLLPVMDDVQLAREHGDLADGPFAAIAEKLESIVGRAGMERYGAVGEEFDPAIHEALMDTPDAEVTTTTVAMVMQPGYRVGERIVRPARVGVKSPE